MVCVCSTSLLLHICENETMRDRNKLRHGSGITCLTMGQGTAARRNMDYQATLDRRLRRGVELILPEPNAFL